MKFSIKDFFSKCDQIRRKLQETADLVPSTEEILNGKLHFKCNKFFFPAILLKMITNIIQESCIHMFSINRLVNYYIKKYLNARDRR